MKEIIKLCLCSIGFSASAVCHAAAVMGASAGYSEYPQYNNVGGSLGGKVFAGYHFDEWPMLVELSYLDTGNHRVDALFLDPAFPRLGGYIGFKGLDASVGFIPVKNPATGASVWIKGGYYNGDAGLKVDGFTGKGTEISTGASLGVGGDWMFKPGLGLRYEYELLFKVKDFSGDNLNGKSNVSLLTLGLVFGFPGNSAPTAVSTAAPESRSAPAITAGPAAAEELPGPAAIPAETPPPPEPISVNPQPQTNAPSPAGAPGAAGAALAHAGAAVRDRPTLNGPVAKTLAADTQVQLISKTRNATGVWWYVKVDNLNGWVRETELQLNLR